MKLRGFILASVLWLLAGLTVVAAVVASYGLNQAQQSQLLRLRAAAETDFVSTQTDVLVLLARTRIARGGRTGASEILVLDNSTYRGAGNTLVRLQDARGLVNLNRADEPLLSALFSVCGADAEAAQRGAASLLDYIDVDSLSRLNGAEREDYEQAGRIGPRNAPLEDVAELWQVLGTEDMRARWREAGCDEAVSVMSDGNRNVRSAPLTALLAWGLPEGQARMLSQRDQLADPTGAAVVAAQRESFDTASNLFANPGTQFPGQIYRVQHFDPASSLLWEYWLRLSTDRAPSPWLIQSVRFATLEGKRREAWPREPARISMLPKLPSLIISPSPNTSTDVAPLDLPFGR